MLPEARGSHDSNFLHGAQNMTAGKQTNNPNNPARPRTRNDKNRSFLTQASLKSKRREESGFTASSRPFVDAICVASGGSLPVPGVRQRASPDPRRDGRTRRSHLGGEMFAAAPKMAGLALEDGSGHVNISASLKWDHEDQLLVKLVGKA
ncbi:hypothetical protein FQA47_018986 [Oryzias melastigma]|uniref:Uncharacterized protein n=1 Tax=Oryzias melastigma TaxID=30732 RepID=A0A834FK25_ORYME|nr:hypothetical protein FQA47_018986 [Oryzias melastigma]